MTAILIALLLLFLATAATNSRSELRTASAKVEPCSEDCLRGKVKKLELRVARINRRSVRIERARNRLRRAMRSSVRLGASGLERGFLCIHHFEGAWTSATGNGFYGGLQMDSSFQSTYGPEFLRAFGPANNWTPAMQLAVAERAYLSGRGYGPWPNTRRSCGI